LHETFCQNKVSDQTKPETSLWNDKVFEDFDVPDELIIDEEHINDIGQDKICDDDVKDEIVFSSQDIEDSFQIEVRIIFICISINVSIVC